MASVNWTKTEFIIFQPNTAPDHGFGRGKRSIAINLKEQAGRKLAFDLCKSADVVIEPYRPGILV